MAQLPPKAPNMTQNWPSLPLPHPHPHPHPLHTIHIPSSVPMITISNAPTTPQPSWVDEFMDFSSARRNAHRRSASTGSIAFLPLLEECPSTPTTTTPSPPGRTTCRGNTFASFERLDDEQLMAMFADEMAIRMAPTSNASTPTSDQYHDRNTNGAEQSLPVPHHHYITNIQHQRPKEEPLEVPDGSFKPKPDDPLPAKPSNYTDAASGDTVTDPKRVKRILANRQSAQRSRVRKLQYISELERSVTSLQTEVSTLSPRVAFLDHQRLILNVDNSNLKQSIAALAQDKIFKDAHQEALKKEIERLRQVYREQNFKKMATAASPQTPSPQPPPSSDPVGSTDDDELLNREGGRTSNERRCTL